MEITPDTAFASAQIIAVLLVATMLDPWAKNTAQTGGTRISRWRRVGAVIAYCAKVVTVVVLLGDMQVVLFDSTRDGTAGLLLVLGNYAAVTVCGMSILLTVLSHFGAIGGPADDAEESEPRPANS